MVAEELEVLTLLPVIILEARVEMELLLLKKLERLVLRLLVCGHKKLSTIMLSLEHGKIFSASGVYPTF